MPCRCEPSISVLIVNWNTVDLLQSCLRSVLATPEALDLEVAVVDNGSIDGSAAMVEQEFPTVELIRNEANEGFARAHNQAFRVTSAPYVLLLNSDTEVPPGTLERCRQHLAANPGTGVVGCRIANPDGSTQNSIFRYPSLRGVASTALWLAQARPNSPLWNHDRYGTTELERPTTVEVVMGSFMMVRRRDLEQNILDDGYFMYAEEADLCRHMSELGKQTVFLPDVSVMHVGGASSRTPAQRAWSDGAKKRSQLRFLRKWQGTGAAALANAAMLIGLLPRILAWGVRDVRSRAAGTEGGELLQARIIGFHLAALLQPSRMSQRFTAPPGPPPTEYNR